MEALDSRSLNVPPIVLFIEPDLDTLDMYSTYFEMSGMWVAKSTSPAEAIAGIAELHPNVVVTGLDFDTTSGADLVRALRTESGTQPVPLIVLSGRSMERIPAAVRDGADLCLMKPVLPDRLLSTVRRLLQKSHELRARSQHARERTDALVKRSNSLLSRAQVIARIPGRNRGQAALSAVWPTARLDRAWVHRRAGIRLLPVVRQRLRLVLL